MKNNGYLKQIIVGLVLVILVAGCAAKNPSKNTGNDDNSGGNSGTTDNSSPKLQFSGAAVVPALSFVALGNLANSNAVFIRQSSISTETLAVEVYANSITENVFGATFHVFFDTTKVEYQNYTSGDFFSAGPASSQVALLNNDLSVYVGYDNPATESNGSGVIINLHFKAINPGDSELSFSDPHLQNNVPQDITVSGWYGGSVSYQENAVSLKKKSIDGDDLWVKVYANDIAGDVYKASFNLVFDPTKLQYQDYSSGDIFTAGTATSGVGEESIDANSAKLSVLVNSSTQGNSSGVIINLHFKAIKQGDSELSFTESESHLQDNVPQDIAVNGWYGGTVSYSF